MELLETHGFHCEELEASDCEELDFCSDELDAGAIEELETV
jgi:hypothetical protein